MKISVLTASVRPEGLDIVYKSLLKQDFPKEEFEWVICGPEEVISWARYQYEPELANHGFKISLVTERDKREDDFYNLTKSYNDLFKAATGELAIMWTDLTWAPNDVLSLFWQHYQKDPKGCVGAVGNQYDPKVIEFGKPQVMIWKDPRIRLDYGSFYEINAIDLEMCLASIPVQAVKDVGGFEEDYDKGAAVGEKELCLRMDKAGYRFYLDQSIEYRALKHPRLAGDEIWNHHYRIACDLLGQHIRGINNGTRIQLDYL